METILITGGNGFLGSHIVKGLLKNFKIIVLEKNTGNLFRLKDIISKIKVFDINTTSPEVILKDNKIDILIHAATNYGRDSSMEQMIADNVLFPVHLLEHAAKNNCKTFINIDSFFNKPENKNYSYLGNYILCKSQLEEWLKNGCSNSKIINIKLEHPYGPFDNPEKFVPMILAKLLAEETPILLTEGNQLRDFINVDDVVSAFSFVLAHNNKFSPGFTQVNLGTGKQISIKEFVETAKRVTGSKSILKFGGLPYRENEIMSSVAKDSLLQKLGWKPVISIEIGLKNLL
jgi:CDP-paratose synthetase